MDLLNLDDLAPAERKVVLAGKEYVLAKQSVRQMMKSYKLAELAEEKKGGEDQPLHMMSAMIQAAKDLLPEAPNEVIEDLTADQISKLMEFANASDEVEAEEEAKDGSKKSQ